MIEFCRGNLLEADADALVNTVNCVGVMGKGIALQFKQAYPANFRDYERACERGEVHLGRMFVHSTGRLTRPRFIINFPTKHHWRAGSRLEDIRSGLADLVRVIQENNISSVAVPPLGCGNGGLDWNEVYPLIETAFGDLMEVQVLLFAPQPAPAADVMPVATKKPRMTRSRALLVLLVDRYQGLGYRLSKLELQKLAYFLQETGEDLRLDFVKHKYGPYAEKLNHAIRNMEGHLLRGFGDRTVESSIHPTPGAVEAAKEFLQDDEKARQRLDRVARLITGFENPYGMELLASIHWVAKEDPHAATEISAAAASVQNWSERKRSRFRSEHIAKAWTRLEEERWLPTDLSEQRGNHHSLF
jgi:O-acetyl-ADP-ribose deacetylase (regulator of RNase III)